MLNFKSRTLKKLSNKKIIFDLGAVILDIKKEQDWWNEDLLPNFDKEQLVQLLKEDFFNNFERGFVSVETFSETMQTIKTNKKTTVEQAWNGILKTIPPHRIELLYKLKKENNQIFLLSNTNQIHTNSFLNDIQAEYGKNIFDELFDIQFYSQIVGMRKPDAEIYEHVQNTIGGNIEDFIFLDDKPENLKVPKQLGWKTILVDKDISELIA